MTSRDSRRNDVTVTCPKCDHTFPIGESMRHGIEVQVELRLKKQYEERIITEITKAKEAGKKEMEPELKRMEEDLKNYKMKEYTLKKREKELNERSENLDITVKKKIEEERTKLEEKMRKEIEEEHGLELEQKSEEVKRKDELLKRAAEREKVLLKEKQELDEKVNELDLQYQRKWDEKRKETEEKVKAAEAERYSRQLSEKDEELERMRKKLEEAQRVGSSGEVLGEVAEKTLASKLLVAFPEDQIRDVPRGKQGGDIIQQIQGGCSLIWESKDVKNWSNDWIPKLRQDRDSVGASIALLVSKVGPGGKELKAPTWQDEVILIPPWLVVGVASLLRPQLIEIARQRRLYNKQESIQAAVYSWVTSQDFLRGVQSIASNLENLNDQVYRAKINHARWFKRMEESVNITIRSVGEFYGSAQSHAQLPDLKILSLPIDTENRKEPTQDNDD